MSLPSVEITDGETTLIVEVPVKTAAERVDARFCWVVFRAIGETIEGGAVFSGWGATLDVALVDAAAAVARLRS